MVASIIGAGAATGASFIPNYRVWNILNLDTDTLLQGQFEAEDVTENAAAAWAEHISLNRQRPIQQFVHGEANTLSFTGTAFKMTLGDTSITDMVPVLRTWIKMDQDLRRPPILHFWIGEGEVSITCVMTSISFKHMRPNFIGLQQHVTFTVNLKEFTSFSLSDAEQTDTRYHVVKEGEYFELLAQREYKNPMLGVVLRERHPGKINLRPGEIVTLPSIEGVRTKTISQKSLVFKGGFGRKLTAQKAVISETLERNSGSYESHI